MSPARAHALMHLHAEQSQGRTPRQSDLQAALGIDKSNISRLVRQMVAAGEVRETICDLDRRARRLTLTARGRRLARRLDTRSLDRFEALIQALAPTHRKEITLALTRLSEAMTRLENGVVTA